MTVVCYTDASYRHEYDIAACGFCVLVSGKIIKHEVKLVSGLKSPSNAEVFAITEAAQFAYLMEGVSKIYIRTDHESTVKRRKKRARFADLNATLEIIKESGIEIHIQHVKGHSTDWHNNLVDKQCRNNLRKYIRENGFCDTQRRYGS